MKSFQVAAIIVLALFLAASNVIEGKYTGRACGKDYDFPSCEDQACNASCNKIIGAIERPHGFCSKDGTKCLCFHPC